VTLSVCKATPIRQEKAWTISRDVLLDRHTTFRVPARAALLADVWDSAALPELFAMPQAQDLPVLVLGGGSNVLFTRDFEGLIIHLSTSGIDILASDSQYALVRVAAGEEWDGFVRWSLEQGLSGLENLILIPGAVGAAPIQNIGAYGVEIGEFVATVEAWDRFKQDLVRLDNQTCAFAYRDSVFKRKRERYVVTAVEFRLRKQPGLRLDYAGVRHELASMRIGSPTPMQVGQAVERLRRRKLPDPSLIGNAGSFFKNPLTSIEHARALKKDHPELPVYPYDEDRCKISAGWLIEACGFKGIREGDAGVSDMHSLVLVNYGAATGAQLWALAVRIQGAVAARFAVHLDPEPLVI
jgi:UDP-N-acetylmuramate dehydrogenase